jgi:hypothetical protein
MSGGPIGRTGSFVLRVLLRGPADPHFVGGTANYLDDRVQNPIPVRRELPLGFAIIDFGTPGGAGAVGRT